MAYKNGSKYYTGKVVGDTYYRNLKFNHAVLWSDREFGLNVEIFDHLKANNIKTIVYIDTAKRNEGYKITLEKFDANKVLKTFKFGRQYFVKVDVATKLTTVPNIPYIKRDIEIVEQ